MRTEEENLIQADFARLKRLAFPDLGLAANRKWRLAHPDRVQEHQKRRWQDNKEKEYRRTQAWVKAHPEKIRGYTKKYREIHRVRFSDRKRKDYLKNRDYIIARSKRNRKERRARDPLFRIVCELRTRLYHALKRKDKSARTMELLGCSVNSFKIYLESQFEPGMSWGNYGRGGWNVDHIMPVAIFDLNKAEHQKRCFHFSNMRPMWERENFSRPKKPQIKC